MQIRRHRDGCAIATGLELIGQRWSLSIIRELMFGGRRFVDLKAAIAGISANVLTQRLGHLTAAGIVTRRKVPPPAPASLYELTHWGYQSDAVVCELGRWAAQAPCCNQSLPISAVSLMLSLRALLSSDRSAGLYAQVGFRFGNDEFHTELSHRNLDVARSDPSGADTVFSAEPRHLAAVIFGGASLVSAERNGAVSIAGDHTLARRFVKLFPLPGLLDKPGSDAD